jgi:phosphohistidine phosphatase
MKLYFLRHGLAGERSEWKADDAKRPLTKAGKEKIEDAAASIAKWDLNLDLIITSPNVRAYQTAEIVAHKLKLLDRLAKDDRVGYGFDADKLAKILIGYPKANALMFVGHEPDFSETITRLIGGGHIVMKKGGLACIDLPDPKALKGELLWLVPPKLMG